MQFPPLVLSASIDSGTGNLELTGFSQRSRQSLPAAVVDGDVFYYGITSQAADQWEEGIGRFVSGSPNELERLRCICSNNNNAFCDFQGGQKLISIVSPSILQAAAHLHKTPVRAVATANVSLSSDISDGDTLDGITLATGDRVLLVNQSTGSQNGIWEVTADTAVRPPDFFPADSARGTMVSVLEGTAGAGKSYICTTAAGSDVIGTDALTWKLAIADISGAILKDGSVAFTGDQSLGNHKLTNVTDPSAAQDAATKNYVDAVARGLDWKASCRAATTGNITLSGEQTIDGVSVVAGNRVLVKDQSTGSQNGIYVAAAGSWSRATDADADAEVTAGLVTTVTEGTANGDKSFVLTTNDPITVGTTALAFSLMGGSSGPVDAAGVTYTPADATDWDSDTDPGDVNNALDQLASRMTTVEDAGTGSGDVATDTIWDAKGDLAVGTGADTAVRLAVGTNGQVLTADSTQPGGVKWNTLPGGGGSVSGPVSSTDRALALFDGTGGNAITDAADWTMSEDGLLTGKATAFPTVVLTYDPDIAIDLNDGNNFFLLAEGDVDSMTIVNAVEGRNFMLTIRKVAGTETVALPENVFWDDGETAGENQPTLTATAGNRDIIGFRCNGNDSMGNPWFDGFAHGLNRGYPPEFTTLLYDSFTGTDSTSISGRAFETGSENWTLVATTGDIQIQGNAAEAITEDGVSGTADCGVTDVRIDMPMTMPTAPASAGAIIAGEDINNAYFCMGGPWSSGAGAQLWIYERTAGSFTQVANDIFPGAALTGVLIAKKTGTTVSVEWNGNTIEYTSATEHSGTLVGMRLSPDFSVDSFLCREPL